MHRSDAYDVRRLSQLNRDQILRMAVLIMNIRRKPVLSDRLRRRAENKWYLNRALWRTKIKVDKGASRIADQSTGNIRIRGRIVRSWYP